MTQQWTITPEMDGEDMIIKFPDELMEQLGWLEGDTINYDIRDGQCFVTNPDADKRKNNGTSEDTPK